MAKTEFHGDDAKNVDRFAPIEIKVEGSFEKFRVGVNARTGKIILTSAGGRDTVSPRLALALAEALTEACEFIEENPPEPETYRDIRRIEE